MDVYHPCNFEVRGAAFFQGSLSFRVATPAKNWALDPKSIVRVHNTMDHLVVHLLWLGVSGINARTLMSFSFGIDNFETCML